jgi:ParB family chromosome partitioning protein
MSKQKRPEVLQFHTALIDSEGRHRKEVGDLDALAKSIADVGLLQPIVVIKKRRSGSYRLVAGERRLRAVALLGLKTIPTHVVSNLRDATALLRAEYDENTCRKDFTPTESVAIGAELEKLEREEAAKRKKSGTNQYTEPSGQLPEGSTGQVRDKVAEAVGMSGKTYEKAKAVVEAAEKEPEKYGDLPKVMDQTGKVDGAFKELRTRQAASAAAATQDQELTTQTSTAKRSPKKWPSMDWRCRRDNCDTLASKIAIRIGEVVSKSGGATRCTKPLIRELLEGVREIREWAEEIQTETEVMERELLQDGGTGDKSRGREIS